jgi:putative endonuclease
MFFTSSIKGRIGELIAATWLWAHGLRIIKRNYSQRMGEIDLIATHQGVLVFIEVRMRRDKKFGGGLASVDDQKQRKLVLTAREFLRRHAAYQNHPCRFDVVSISRPNCFLRLQWIRNAFSHDYSASDTSPRDFRSIDRLRVWE